MTMTITDDQLVEGTENVLIQLSAPTNATLGVSQTVLTDILDNDIVRVSFEAGNVTEWEGGVVPVKVKLSNVWASIASSSAARSRAPRAARRWECVTPADATRYAVAP